MSDNSTALNNLSKIDAAIAAAKARKAAREAAASTAPVNVDATEEVESTSEETAQPKPRKISAEDREAKKAQILADREARKAAKQASKQEKVATRSTPAHMSKVDKAASRLPALDTDEAKGFLKDLIAQLNTDELSAIALHLQHHVRVQATQRALTTKIEAGTAVRIIGGDPKFVGKTGVIFKAQRIRCYVTVPGVNKPVYLFTSDVTPVEVETIAPSEVEEPTERGELESTGTEC